MRDHRYKVSVSRGVPVYSPAFAGTHCTYPPWRDGQAELTWVAGYIPRWFTRRQTVTRPSTNRARHRVTLLITTNALPTAPCHHLISYKLNVELISWQLRLCAVHCWSLGHLSCSTTSWVLGRLHWPFVRQTGQSDKWAVSSCASRRHGCGCLSLKATQKLPKNVHSFNFCLYFLSFSYSRRQ